MALDNSSLDAIFRPKTIAVIGAKDTEGSVGKTVMQNLCQKGFSGTIIPVNPHRTEVLGLPCIPSVLESKIPIDLAVIIVKAPQVPEIMKQCVLAKVKAAIIISSGFKEIGPEGKKLEDAIAETAKKGLLRVIGPNCLGVMNPSFGLNASFSKGMAKDGSLAFISQSGAMCTAVLDWSLSEEIGFSAFVSIGSMADVGWGDLIEYFGRDEKTKGILMYMETVGDPKSFIDAASKVSFSKPIIVIKPGKSKEAVKAAASHTGALSGSDDVFQAACDRSGIVRVNTISELFAIAEVLSGQPHPKGPNLAIITNAGGPSVLATDAVVTYGGALAPLSKDTINTLQSFLPSAWSHGNPIDVLGDALPDRYERTIETVIKDPNVDGILTILTPQDMTDPEKTASVLSRVGKDSRKPLLASWMGGKAVEKGSHILLHDGIPCFHYPDEAAWSFATMWKHAKTLQELQKSSFRGLSSDFKVNKERVEKARALIQSIRAQGRKLLSEYESKELMRLYGIPVVETLLAKDEDEASLYAERLGYPVVVKIDATNITHKSEIHGVRLNLRNEEEVRDAFSTIRKEYSLRYSEASFTGVTVQKMFQEEGVELIIGSSTDPQFGPVILFGSGGVYVEVFQDKSLGFPPLDAPLARRMIAETRILKALKKFRGREAISFGALENVLIALSDMLLELPEIVESDLNPIVAHPKGVICLDARILLGKL